MAIPEGLRTALNEIRATSIESNTLYAKSVVRGWGLENLAKK